MREETSNVAVVKRMALGDGAGASNDVQLDYSDTMERRVQANSDQQHHALDTLHSDVIINVPPSMPYGGEYVGHDGFLRMNEAMSATWDLNGPLSMRFADIGSDQVICFVNFEAISRRTGKPVEMRMVEVFTLDASKIRDIRLFYWDTAAVASATAVSDQPESRE